MLSFLVHWAVQAIALYVAARLVGGIHLSSDTTLIIAALVIGLINATIRPVLTLLSLPLTILTLGLFYLVVNGACFMLAAALVPGFHVQGCTAAILGALVMSLVGWALHAVLPTPRR